MRARLVTRRRAGALAAAAVVVLAVLALWRPWREAAPPGPSGAPVPVARSAAGLTTVVIETRTVEAVTEAVGTVRASLSATVSSKATGRVADLRVRSGDRVERGQVLLVVAGEETGARVDQARAALEAAEAALADAERELARMRRLVAEQIIARRELEAAEARAQVARARVREARSAVSEASALAGDLVVRAPMTGVVAETLVDVGDLAAPGRPLLTVYDPTRLRLEAPVRESLARRLAPGQSVRVVVDAIGAEVDGTVEVVVPEADPAARSFLVKAALPRVPGLYPGMFGRLRFPTGTVEILAVPRRAVRPVGQLETVDVVEDDVVRTRQVRLGRSYGDLVEVLAGLSPGERVVLP